MLCGVTATLGSNPSATATAARPHWGRAVLLCLAGVPCGCVAPRVFRAPEGLAVGPGCCVCPWAAARPRAVRAASFARRVVSKPGQAPPPPTGTAAWPTSPFGALHTSVVGSLMSGSARRLEARPGPAAAHGHRSLAHQSLRCPPHQWGWVADVRLGASPRTPTRPCRFLWASQGPRVLSFWGALVRVVTNVVNWRCFSCGFLPRCYKRRQSECFFAENGGFWA